MSDGRKFPTRAAVVTGVGAPRGIGRVVARRLAAEGWSLGLADGSGPFGAVLDCAFEARNRHVIVMIEDHSDGHAHPHLRVRERHDVADHARPLIELYQRHVSCALPLIAKRQLHARVAHVVPAERAAEGFRLLGTPGRLGKVLLDFTA